MNYELLGCVIDSAKNIVAGRGDDEDEMDIEEWGAEAIVTLNKDLGDMEMHLRELVNAMAYMTIDSSAPASVYSAWFKADNYLKSLEE